MSEKLYLYPLWVRLWHGVNAILCLILIITGFGMRFVDLDISQYRIAFSSHWISGCILSLNYLFFVLGNLNSSNGKYYRLQFKHFFKDNFLQLKYYVLGTFMKEKAPFPITKKSKFNPLQKLIYVLIMYILMPLIIISGWILLFPDFMLHQGIGIKNLQFIDFVHLILGYIISVFLIIHVFLSVGSKFATGNFRSIINGYHEKHS